MLHAGSTDQPRPGYLMTRRLRTLCAAGAIALAIGACGGGTTQDGGPRGTAGPRPAEREPSVDLAGGPRTALAANAAQADQLVGEGADDLKTRLAALRGHPVVVNQWGSWCPPCRAEFPYFAQMAAKYEDRVAFLGLDAADSRGAAEQFMREVPPGFPSIFDPDSEATRSLRGGRISPTTFLLDATGKQVDIRLGAYAGAADLERDIQQLLAAG